MLKSRLLNSYVINLGLLPSKGYLLVRNVRIISTNLKHKIFDYRFQHLFTWDVVKLFFHFVYRLGRNTYHIVIIIMPTVISYI